MGQRRSRVFEDHWQTFWSNQTTSLRGQDTDRFNSAYGKELRLLFEDEHPRRVLEIGCGDGSLYRHVGFDQAEVYRGVDISPSMLAEFERRHPQVRTVCSPGQEYLDNNTWDLIFANQVLQYLTKPMLNEMFSHARAMLAENGVMVCAGIPWRRLRFEFYRGDLAVARKPGFRNGAARTAFGYLYRLWKPDLGKWYDLEDFEELADKFSMSVKFYSSMNYMYRFHAVLHPKESTLQPLRLL